MKPSLGPNVQKEIAGYIRALAESSRATSRAEDRALYEKHLAAAAVFLADFVETGSLENLRQALVAEERSFGWAFLDGEAGRAAEAAFGRLLGVVQR